MKVPGLGAARPGKLEHRLLLTSTHPDGGGGSRIQALKLERVNWETFWPWAVHHKLAALSARRLSLLELEPGLSPELHSRLKRIERSARKQADRAGYTLRTVASQLESRRIPFLLLKGPVLAEHLYGEPTLRPFHDIDILVPESQITGAQATLESMGYKLYIHWIPSNRTPTAADLQKRRQESYHFNFVHPERDRFLPVEVHWDLKRPGTLKSDPATLRQHAAPLQVSGTSVQTFNWEATLVHLAVHALAVRGIPLTVRLLHLCDVAWFGRRLRRRCRPQKVWDIATQWGARHHLACALEAARILYPDSWQRTTAWDRLPHPVARSCFRRAVDNGILFDRPLPDRRTPRILALLRMVCLLDLAMNRFPRGLLGHLSAGVSSNFRRFRALLSSAG